MQRKQPMRITTKKKQPHQQRKKKQLPPQKNKEDKDNGIRGDIIST
jgi:hypothetical protein